MWVATYSGDTNNAGSTHPCGQAKEITAGRPGGADHHDPGAGGDRALGPTVTLTDTATLTGATVGRRRRRGRSPSVCTARSLSAPGAGQLHRGQGWSGPAVRLSTATGPTRRERHHGERRPGFYTWVATYSGDANNEHGDARLRPGVRDRRGAQGGEHDHHGRRGPGPAVRRSDDDHGQGHALGRDRPAGGHRDDRVQGLRPVRVAARCRQLHRGQARCRRSVHGQRERGWRVHLAGRHGEEGRLLRLGRQLLR